MLVCWLIIQEANFTKRTFPCMQRVQVKFLAMPGLAVIFLKELYEPFVIRGYNSISE